MSELLIFLVPLLVPLIAKNYWKTKINWHEFGINVVIVLATGGLLLALANIGQTVDSEIWNGQVTGKSKVRVSCSHSYSCPPCVKSCSGSGSNKTCTETCSTCYDHSNDWDWDVYTNISTVSINRIDRQGSKKPPRWNIIEKGDPVAFEKKYTNYVQAVPESLFNNQGLKMESLPASPTYPTVYDYYNINRVLPVGVTIPDLNEWNKDLSMILRKLGPQKQANVIIIPVNTADQNYRYKVESDWIGGNKNDIVVFIGTTSYPEIDWVDVMTFASNKGNELFHVKLTSEILEAKTMDRQKIIPIIEAKVLAHFDRPEMKQFEYLKEAIKPPQWAVFVIFLFQMILSIGLTYYFHRNDVKLF